MNILLSLFAREAAAPLWTRRASELARQIADLHAARAFSARQSDALEEFSRVFQRP